MLLWKPDHPRDRTVIDGLREPGYLPTELGWRVVDHLVDATGLSLTNSVFQATSIRWRRYGLTVKKVRLRRR